jgi:hypothetical protein
MEIGLNNRPLAKIISLRGNPLGIEFLWFNALYTIDVLPQIVPKQKSCQTPGKWVIINRSVIIL